MKWHPQWFSFRDIPCKQLQEIDQTLTWKHFIWPPYNRYDMKLYIWNFAWRPSGDRKYRFIVTLIRFFFENLSNHEANVFVAWLLWPGSLQKIENALRNYLQVTGKSSKNVFWATKGVTKVKKTPTKVKNCKIKMQRKFILIKCQLILNFGSSRGRILVINQGTDLFYLVFFFLPKLNF